MLEKLLQAATVTFLLELLLGMLSLSANQINSFDENLPVPSGKVKANGNLRQAVDKVNYSLTPSTGNATIQPKVR